MTVRGRVLAADTRLPLPLARVSLEGSNTTQTTKSDMQGRFEFADLGPGQYFADASKTGYVMARWVFGWRRTVAAKSIQLKAGSEPAEMELLLPRGAVISGRVTMPDGQPAISSNLELWRRAYVNGRRELNLVSRTTTNDRGEYRFHGLAADTYVVATTRVFPSYGDGFGLAPVYYQGTTDPAEARAIPVRAGEEAAGIDLTYTAARFVRISGMTYDTQGRPLIATMASLCWDQVCPYSSSSGTTAGMFSLSNVPPGRWELGVTGRNAEGEREGGSIYIEVGSRDVSGIVVTATRPSTVTGRLAFEGSDARRPTPGEMPLIARQMSPRTASDRFRDVTVKADGSLSVGYLAGPRVFRFARLPDGWTLKSVVLDGRDITDTPVAFARGQDVKDIVITLTDRVTRLEAIATSADGTPAPDAHIVVFAAESARWAEGTRFVAAKRAGADGVAAFAGLPAGEYLAVALDSLEEGEEEDVQFLASVQRRATPIVLSTGETARIVLPLSSRR